MQLMVVLLLRRLAVGTNHWVVVMASALCELLLLVCAAAVVRLVPVCRWCLQFAEQCVQECVESRRESVLVLCGTAQYTSPIAKSWPSCRGLVCGGHKVRFQLTSWPGACLGAVIAQAHIGGKHRNSQQTVGASARVQQGMQRLPASLPAASSAQSIRSRASTMSAAALPAVCTPSCLANANSSL